MDHHIILTENFSDFQCAVLPVLLPFSSVSLILLRPVILGPVSLRFYILLSSEPIRTGCPSLTSLSGPALRLACPLFVYMFCLNPALRFGSLFFLYLFFRFDLTPLFVILTCIYLLFHAHPFLLCTVISCADLPIRSLLTLCCVFLFRRITCRLIYLPLHLSLPFQSNLILFLTGRFFLLLSALSPERVFCLRLPSRRHFTSGKLTAAQQHIRTDAKYICQGNQHHNIRAGETALPFTYCLSGDSQLLSKLCLCKSFKFS